MATVPEDAIYKESTQYRLWSMSRAKVAEMRTTANTLARESIAPRLAAAATAAAAPNAGGNDDNNNTRSNTGENATESPPLPEFLAPDEEVLLLTFYTLELLNAATFCKLPTEIRATAAVFLRRFYLTNSVMTYPPKELLKTCLFFGAKVEGYYTSLAKFADNFPNTKPEEIIAGEFLLCQGLRFAFDVRHPYRALEGAMMHLRTGHPQRWEHNRLARAHTGARDILKYSPLMTDSYFHYTPSQIMLAALGIVDREMMETFVEDVHAVPAMAASNSKNARAKSGGKSENAAALPPPASVDLVEVRKTMMAPIERCREMLEQELPERMTSYWGTPDSNKLLKPLLKKLRKCHDPDRWDLVGLQKSRREQLRRQAVAAKSLATDGLVFRGPTLGMSDGAGGGVFDIPKRRKMPAGEDPFGGPLVG